MRARSRLALAAFLAAPSFLAGVGCNNTDVPLEKVPLVQIPESKAPDQQPKHLRPQSGSSAGMNYDPSGVNSAGPKK